MRSSSCAEKTPVAMMLSLPDTPEWMLPGTNNSTSYSLRFAAASRTTLISVTVCGSSAQQHKKSVVVKWTSCLDHRRSAYVCLRVYMCLCVFPFCFVHRSTDSQCFWTGRTTPENCPFPWARGGSRLLSNIWFLGTTWMSHPNGISIGSDVFAGVSASPTHTHTDRPRCVRHLWEHAMRPNNFQLDTTKQLVSAFIFSRLDYCNAVLFATSVKHGSFATSAERCYSGHTWSATVW